jgi:hypothetical protein
MNEEQRMSDREENSMRETITRRQFMKSMATLVGAGLLSACGTAPGEGQPFSTATPARMLPVDGAPTLSATGMPEGAISLDQFLALSSLLTGVDNLDPGLGQIYLQALAAGAQPGSTLSDVYSAASSGSNLPQDVQTLQQSGFFQQPGVGDLADTILTLWYTGVYQLDGQDTVATYVDALSWKVLHFTKPATTCGHFGKCVFSCGMSIQLRF